MDMFMTVLCSVLNIVAYNYYSLWKYYTSFYNEIFYFKDNFYSLVIILAHHNLLTTIILYFTIYEPSIKQRYNIGWMQLFYKLVKIAITEKYYLKK